MEQIKYRKTLDVHKNGVQFMLQGFETEDKLSRVIEISLMASGDAIDFPLEKVEALMYVTTPNATEPSINACTIEDNKVVYNVLPIVEEGITTMQLKIISSSTDGARGVLASPKFSVEVTKSGADDESAEQTTTFTALEEAMAKAKTVYDERFLRMELAEDCTFRAYYADGTIYETDILKRLFNNGNVLLSESYAHGGTGVRAGEDTDNSKYYSNISKSEALNAKNIMENSEEILEDVRKRGTYTAFSVDFESGEVEYVSTSSAFIVDKESGELEATKQKYSFEEEVFGVVDDWIESKGKSLDALNESLNGHSDRINTLEEDSTTLKTRVTPVELGGTGAITPEEAVFNLGVDEFLSGDVLWENPNITAELPATTVDINTEGYKRYVATYAYSASTAASEGAVYCTQPFFQSVRIEFGTTTNYRVVSVKDGVLSITKGTEGSSATTDNKRFIIGKIIGYKW